MTKKKSECRSWPLIYIACGAISAILITSGCVTAKYPEVPKTTENANENYEYDIGFGDNLNIFVWGYADLADSVQVRPDGKITTKMLEDIDAVGRTPNELARDIEAAYSEFVNAPIVSVSINEFAGNPSQQLKIVGATEEAITLPYSNGTTLLDLIIEAGGVSEFASGNRAVLVRRVDGKRENYSLRIDDLIRKGDISANIEMQPGDIVLIPEARF